MDHGLELALGLVSLGLALFVIGIKQRSRPKYCTRCGHIGPPGFFTGGSPFVAAILWLCLIVPGLLYSMWKIARSRGVCTRCGDTILVPPDSALAKQLSEEC